jgi:hypothetical protein
VIEVAHLAKLLSLSSLDPTEVERRASVLAEDIEWIGLETFRLSVQNYGYRHPATGEIISRPLGEYYFGDTGFSDWSHASARESIPGQRPILYQPRPTA